MMPFEDVEPLDEEAMMGSMMEHYQGVNPYGAGAHGFQPPQGSEHVWNGGPAMGAGDVGPTMAGGMGMGAEMAGGMAGPPGGGGGPDKKMMQKMLYERMRKLGGNNEAYQER